jgi:hypothetical protein
MHDAPTTEFSFVLPHADMQAKPVKCPMMASGWPYGDHLLEQGAQRAPPACTVKVERWLVAAKPQDPLQ